jgi:N-acetyltransferase
MFFDGKKLRGQIVFLEPLQNDHIGHLKQIARDERIWEFTKTIIVDDSFEEQFNNYITLAQDPNAFGAQYSFVIRNVIDNRIIGMTRVYSVEPKHKRLTIGYTWYIPEVWGKIHNKECKLLLLQYAFEELQYNRVEFYIAEANIRSQKAVEKIGGVKEGLLRKHSYRADGSITGVVIYSIIIDEWPERKKTLKQMIQAATDYVNA